MAPRKNVKPPDLGLKRDEGRLKTTSFVQAQAINQKNYYTEYLKRDDQAIVLRQVAEDFARVKEQQQQQQKQQQKPATVDGKHDDEMDIDDDEQQEEAKIIVIHHGSRNIRIGLGSDAYAKTVPAVIAHRIDNENENDSNDNDNNDDNDNNNNNDQFERVYKIMQADFKERMRFYKRRIPSNSHESVTSFNKRVIPEEIPDHNDPYRIEWTDVNLQTPRAPKFFIGDQALKIPADSRPRYKLSWPILHGFFNEQDYGTRQAMLDDLALIFQYAIKQQLGISSAQTLAQYSVVLVIADLYDKAQVAELIELWFRDLSVSRVCVLQESVAAAFGAGISSACVVDIGAQKTAITCVDEGLCVTDSRVNLPYGGDDITALLAKLLTQSNFPYTELDLNKRYYDWALMEDIKSKFVTTNDAEITVQLYNFYQRAPGSPTHKYSFKTFDEVILAPMAYFFPDIFENISKRLWHRHQLFERSVDLYDGTFNDPYSEAQVNLYAQYADSTILQPAGVSTPKPSKLLVSAASVAADDTPTSSVAGTPVPDFAPTITHTAAAVTATTTGLGSLTGNAASRAAAGPTPQTLTLGLLDTRTVIAAPLDQAIIESIWQTTKQDEGKAKRLFENIMLVGGGAASIPAFNKLLEDRIRMWAGDKFGRGVNGSGGNVPNVAVMPTPRDMDPTMLAWKGAAVFVKLKIAAEMWIGVKDWDLLGSRTLQYKCLFAY
ncbi:hypothetical protein V1514DRAFT_339047 [Lipomyces japonicus]|uniref:uncharacterized protein n=1 Tax=Lipomyces japonicus TaxID=56871 RepID=UPI0034CF58D4